MSLISSELWQVFDARRVKSPELRGVDQFVSGFVGWAKNKRRHLARLRPQADRVEKLEPEIHNLGAAAFAAEVAAVREHFRLGRDTVQTMDRALALAREAVFRAIALRPFHCQIMGASAMIQGLVAEMATGEGKTLTAAMAASIWAWLGKPVHIITVNDYLVDRDAHEMGPIYHLLGLKTGFVIHDTTPSERFDHYRRNVVYVTSKELVADFLRDQIMLGHLRTSTQTAVGMLLAGPRSGRLLVPGIWRVIVDEADSLLIDEGVTPLIISNNPDTEANAALYSAAGKLAEELELNRDFTIDWAVRQCELNDRGSRALDLLAPSDESSFWKGRRRREELVTLALTARRVSGMDIYGYMGSLSVYGFITVYFLVAAALPIYLRRRAQLTPAALILAAAAAVAMLLAMAGTLYTGEPIPPPYNILPYLYLAYLALGLTISLLTSRRQIRVY